MDEKVLQIVLQARDNASAVIKNAGSSFTGLSDQAKKGAEDIKNASLIASAAVIGIGAYSIKAAGDFQASMNLIQTQAGASTVEVQKMSAAVLDMATKTGSSPDTLATGLYHIESAGFRGAQALNMLRAAAEGAKVGNANLEDVTQAMISITASHIKGVKDETQAMGILNAIVGAGDMKMEGLAQAMSTGVVPSAAAFGLKMQDVGAALATLTDNAVPPIDAATRLRMSISMMGAPSAAAAKALKGIGLSSTQLADDMRNGGIVKAMEDFNTHLKAVQPIAMTAVAGTKMTGAQLDSLKQKISNTQAQLKIYGEEHVKAGVATDKHTLAVDKSNQKLAQYESKLGSANAMMVKTGGQALTLSQQQEVVARAFGGGRESATILTLLNQMDRLKSKYQDISEGAKKFNDDWAKTQQNVNFQMQQLSANSQVAAIRLGDMLLPSVNRLLVAFNTQMLPAIKNASTFLMQHKDILALVAAVIGSVVVIAFYAWAVSAAAALAPTVALIATATILGAPIWGVALAIGAAVGVIALLVIHFKDIQKVMANVGTAFKTVGGLLQQFFSGGDVTIKKGQESYIGFVKVLDAVHDFFSTAFSGMATTLKNFSDAVLNVLLIPFRAYMAVIRFELTILWDFFAVGFAGIKLALTMFGNWFWSTFGKQITSTFDLIRNEVMQYVNVWVERWNFAKNIVNSIWNSITSFLSSQTSGMANDVNSKMNFISNIIDTNLKKINDGWTKMWGGMRDFVTTITNDIVSSVKNSLNSIISFFDNLIHGANKVGAKVPGFINIPDIPHFQDGGWVPSTGLAVVHQGEFVVSNAMLAGNQSMPSHVMNKTSFSQPITIQATISNGMDINELGYKLAFMLRNSR